MKATITLTTMFLLISFTSVAQTSKWFVTAGSGYTVGGPANSLKNKMSRAGWDDREDGLVFFFSYSVDYPTKTQYLPLMISAGKKLKENKSLFFTAGLADKGSVEGFKKEGDEYFLVIGGSYGRYISVDYQEWQLSCGYQYSFPNTRVKLGFGPSLILLNSKETAADSSTSKHNSITPGVVGNAPCPWEEEED